MWKHRTKVRCFLCYIFHQHILVRDGRLELPAWWSQTYVWTFSEGSCALFGTFQHSCGSALELYWPVYFRHRFRLLGFVWDWILYIKSASDRVYIQHRVLLPQRAAQKLRRINKEISAGVILPTLSINGKCVVVAKTPSENVQTKKKLAHFLWFLHRAP